VQGLLAGSIGVIEEFFGAELVADDSHHARRDSVITPTRIAGLPWERRAALGSALMAPGERPVEDYRRALQSEPNGTRPTMLIAYPTLGGRYPFLLRDQALEGEYRTLEDGLRVVAYFGRVLVDDPLSSATIFGRDSEAAADEDLYEVLTRLAQVRPLIAGGYIAFFPPELAERLRDADPAIAKENAKRRAQEDNSRRELEGLWDIFSAQVTPSMRSEALNAPWDPALDRLAASIGLGVDAMDTTGDRYVLRYLGETLTAFPTSLASVQLPRLELLPPRELAALLSSDEVLAEVRTALDEALRSVPEGLAHDPELATRWVDERLAGNFEAAVHRLRRSIRRLPDAAKIGSAAGGVGATVLAGALTASPTLALGVGAVGAAADLTASWLHQWHQHNKQQSAVRVLTHLTSRPQTARRDSRPPDWSTLVRLEPPAWPHP
jgi:hypothetical protein